MAHGFKTGGRQKGTPNKATAKLRQLVTDSVEQYMSAGMMADLEKVTPAERLKHLHELLKLTVPKPVDTEPVEAATLPVPVIVRVSDMSKRVPDGRPVIVMPDEVEGQAPTH